jgi:hypothetical protein
MLQSAKIGCATMSPNRSIGRVHLENNASGFCPAGCMAEVGLWWWR